MIREHGFLAPETLITNDPDSVREFRAKHGRVIYKSISAVRSIVQELSDEDEERLDRIRWCPTQFQAFVEGTNLRVHTVGGEAFATAVRSEATDYWYAARQAGEPAELREMTLSSELSEKCLRLSQALELEFAGIDLKVTPQDDVYCFEVNPSPAYSYYGVNTAGQPFWRRLRAGRHRTARGSPHCRKMARSHWTWGCPSRFNLRGIARTDPASRNFRDQW